MSMLKLDEYAANMTDFIVKVRKVKLADLNAEIIADAMLPHPSELPSYLDLAEVWQSSFEAADRALVEMRLSERRA